MNVRHRTVLDNELRSIPAFISQKTSDCSEKLYTRYKKVYGEYISKVVLQTLRESDRYLDIRCGAD